jgi:hypothetical protein
MLCITQLIRKIKMKRNYTILSLVGRKFGKWSVIAINVNDKPGVYYECQCDCGNIAIIPGTTLRAWRSTQCKECNYNIMYSPEKMIGRKFGRWTVVEYTGVRCKLQQFSCRCYCGTVKTLYGADLRAGKTKQCTICHNRQNAQNNTKHGYWDTPTYKIWQQMIQRCTNPKSSGYQYYGGRGIKVCDRWLKFEYFLKDMGGRPSKLTIDRIDNDGNYEPENCRWVTHKVNCNNRHRKKTDETNIDTATDQFLKR